MRLIDGETLLGQEKLLDTDIVQQSKIATFIMGQVLFDIASSPTIDAVPVVRCGQCEFWQNDGVHIYGMCKNLNIGNVKLDTDYCSYGVSGRAPTDN